LSERFGNTITINHKESGKGLLSFKYANLDELDKIIANLKLLTWKNLTKK